MLAKQVKKATAAKRHLWNVIKLAGELRGLEAVPCDDLTNLEFHLTGAEQALRHYMVDRLGMGGRAKPQV
jgi:hypothetical protein